MDNNRNTFLAIALSILVIIAWQFLYVTPKLEAEREAAEIERRQIEQSQTQNQPQVQTQPGQAQPGQAQQGGADSDIPQPVQPGTQAAPGGDAPPVPQNSTVEAALAQGERVPFENSHVSGSINLRGARIDDMLLKEYRQTVDPQSDLVRLMSPSAAENGYFAELGWVGSSGGMQGPDHNAQWRLESGSRLTPGAPITLSWTNEAGVVFRRTIEIDDDYLFTVTDTVENGSAGAVVLFPYGRVTRFGKPPSLGNFVLHEGMIGVFGEGGLEQYSYSDIEDEREFTLEQVRGGWIGITDKYWATALVPPQGYTPKFSYRDAGRTSYQSDYLGEPVTINAGGTASLTQLVFAGAKEVDIIDNYQAQRDVQDFELLIDWGWFYFLTKPTFYLLDWLFRLVGNFGVAILIGTVLIKAALFPLANMSYKSMAQMKKLQPEMVAMRERYGDDKVKLQQEMMALYKKEKINPAAGCWPILIQIPIFFALYKVLFITIEMRHAPFFGWIQDLAAPDPTSIFNLFGLLPYDPGAVPLLGPLLVLGVWPIIMGVTMFLQMQMNPTPPDPTQAMIFKWMPLVFTFMLASFPAGLVIYWAWNNFLSILQQGVIMRRQGVKIELWDNLRGMFKKSAKPAE